MSDQPICGACRKVMTRENARLRPELFLHDDCLPDELKPRPLFPGECGDCGMMVHSDAEAFLHANVHADQRHLPLPCCPGDLSTLPFIFYPAIARLLEEYKQSV